MRMISAALAVSLLLALYGCGPSSSTAAPTPVSSDTSIPPTVSLAPTITLGPSSTPVPPTPTSTPLRVLLRRKCGGEYLVTASKPVQIAYGGWAVQGRDLAEQWMTVLTVQLTIDGVIVPGELQPVADDLPWNCTQDPDDTYWLYYTLILPGLSSGRHPVTVTFHALRPLPDGSGMTFGPGQILKQDFTLDVR
jgi:hypothetical protein